MFWRLAKKLHPDVSKLEENNAPFVSLKSQYDEAHKEFGNHGHRLHEEAKSADRKLCMQLFTDLVAGNFPIDQKVKKQNKIYRSRLEALNRELGRFGPEYRDLILLVEAELYRLRGKTTVSNHEYGLLKLFFYRLSDYYYLKTKNTENYLKIAYPMLIDILRARNMDKSVVFINWLAQGLNTG